MTGIHPTAFVDPSVHVGRGATIGPFSVISAGVVIGDGAVIQGGGRIGQVCTIGARSVLKWGATITAYTQIGNDVFLGPYAICLGPGFDEDPKQDRSTRIEDDVRIGSKVDIAYGCSIVSGVRVGRGAFVRASIREPGIYIDHPRRGFVRIGA